MNYVAIGSSFRFSMREKDGVVLFSYYYWVLNVGLKEKEDLPVDPAYIRELREFEKTRLYACQSVLS